MGVSDSILGRGWLPLSAACLLLGSVPAMAQQAAPASKVTEGYCLKCHNATDWAGGVAMDTLDVARPAEASDVWENAIKKLRGRLMPPAGEQQPSQADIDAMVAYLEGSLDKAASGHTHVAHVPMQRLNRNEFVATVRDLIGVDINARQALPTEVEVEGFSNIARALTMSPSFMEQYLTAARRAARLAMGEPVAKLEKVTIPVTPASAADFPLGTRGGMPRGGLRFSHVFPADGEYEFNIPEEDFIDMGLYPRGAQTAATLVLLIDGVERVRKDIGGPEWLDIADRDGKSGRKELLSRAASRAHVTAGRHDVVLTFIERSRALSNDATVGGGFVGGVGGGYGPGRVSDIPILQTAIQIDGPYTPKGLSLSDSRGRILVCTPASPAEERPCAERIARHLAARAYRRPVNDGDVQRLMKLYELGRQDRGGFDSGVTELVTAVLSSPDFLYRALPTPNQVNDSRLLTDLELASRLSFFLWSSGPDQPLLDLAAAGKLSQAGVLQAQVARMLKDDRARALVETFALNWLNLDDLDKVEPIDPSFNAAMRSNFATEIRLFLASVLLQDRSVTDLINADWTFVNEALARQYGINDVRGPQFRRVQLKDERRFGLLGKGAVLLHTSYADRTSPVLRGEWVLGHLIGTPPAPPPPNVNTDLGVKDGAVYTTVRARLEQHRKNPSCNACHGVIDPPGLALENFDNTGRWRDVDAAAKAPIDAKTTLTSGKVINGPVELRRYLSERRDQFPTTVTTRLMMYALNRELDAGDMPLVRQIVRDAAASNYRLSALLNGIVTSDAFRRQGPEAQDAPRQSVARTP
jgi:hypothetical protein